MRFNFFSSSHSSSTKLPEGQTLADTLSINLTKGLPNLLLTQAKDFLHFYIPAFICLFLTHFILSYLPIFAKELAEFNSTIAPSTFFLMALGIIIFRTSSRWLFFYPARIMQKRIRIKLVNILENSSPFRYNSYSHGQLFQIINNDVNNIRALAGFVVLQIGNIIVASSILIPRIANHHPSLIYALTPMLVCLLLFAFIIRKNRELYKENQENQGVVQNFIMESFSGKKTIKNFNAEESFTGLFHDYSWKELTCFYKASAKVAISRPLIPLGVGVSLLWGAYIIKLNNLGAPTLILFSGYIFLFLEPLIFVSWIGVVLTRSIGSWDRIKVLVESFENTSTQEQELASANAFTSPHSFNIDFWQQKMTIHLERGKWTAIIGETGCGKSVTLQKIAAILKTKGLNLSFIGQNPYIYNDTIRNNIFLGNDSTPQGIEQAHLFLKLFELDFLADDQESILDLEVGENGKRISGGQAKRLCAIRTLLSNADYLLWDDPFSSVDILSEKIIIERLRCLPQLQNKTILLTSHRVSTVKATDNIIFLKKNVGIIESGESLALLNSNGSTTSETYEHFKNQLV